MSSLAKNGILVFLAVGCGVALSARPWMLWQQERQGAAQKIAAAKIDEARMVRDQTEEARLGTELGKEELLRKQGYKKQGEVDLPQ